MWKDTLPPSPHSVNSNTGEAISTRTERIAPGASAHCRQQKQVKARHLDTCKRC